MTEIADKKVHAALLVRNVRHVYPNATEKECHDILMNETAFPFSTDPVFLRRQLIANRRTERRGWLRCDHCHRRAVRPKLRPCMCRSCAAALSFHGQPSQQQGYKP